MHLARASPKALGFSGWNQAPVGRIDKMVGPTAGGADNRETASQGLDDDDPKGLEWLASTNASAASIAARTPIAGNDPTKSIWAAMPRRQVNCSRTGRKGPSPISCKRISMRPAKAPAKASISWECPFSGDSRATQTNTNDPFRHRRNAGRTGPRKLSPRTFGR